MPVGQRRGDQGGDQGADHGGADAGADLLRGVVEGRADRGAVARHRVDEGDGADRHDGPQSDGHHDHARPRWPGSRGRRPRPGRPSAPARNAAPTRQAIRWPNRLTQPLGQRASRRASSRSSAGWRGRRASGSSRRRTGSAGSGRTSRWPSRSTCRSGRSRRRARCRWRRGSRSSIGDGVRRSCQTKPKPATTAPTMDGERDDGEPAVLDAAGQRSSRRGRS